MTKAIEARARAGAIEHVMREVIAAVPGLACLVVDYATVIGGQRD
jgi:hypothetical protein